MSDYPSLPFIIFSLVFLLCWVVLITFRPPFVRFVEPGHMKPTAYSPADPTKAFSFSFVVAILAVLALWICG